MYLLKPRDEDPTYFSTDPDPAGKKMQIRIRIRRAKKQRIRIRRAKINESDRVRIFIPGILPGVSIRGSTLLIWIQVQDVTKPGSGTQGNYF